MADAVTASSLRKRYASFQLQISELSIEKGHLVSILGQNGSGKSTLLSLLGGFVAPEEGEIKVCGRPVGTHRGPDREIRTLFQEFALFPHLNVREQLRLAATTKGLSKKALEERVDEWIIKLGLELHADAMPSQLAGGLSQRVALGRALISYPRVLLLDEPLSRVDIRKRDALWKTIVSLTEAERCTSVVITHDPELALAYSDRLLVMSGGQMIQYSTPLQAYEQPATDEVACLTGPANVITVGGRKAIIRPERIEIQAEPPSADVISHDVEIVRRAFVGDALELTVVSNNFLLLVRRPIDEPLHLRERDSAYVWWLPENVAYLKSA